MRRPRLIASPGVPRPIGRPDRCSGFALESTGSGIAFAPTIVSRSDGRKASDGPAEGTARRLAIRQPHRRRPHAPRGGARLHGDGAAGDPRGRAGGARGPAGGGIGARAAIGRAQAGDHRRRRARGAGCRVRVGAPGPRPADPRSTEPRRRPDLHVAGFVRAGAVRRGRRDAHPARPRPDARVLQGVRAPSCGRS